MPRTSRILLPVLFLATGLSICAQREDRPLPPSHVEARRAREQAEQKLAQDAVPPGQPRPDWKKARADADRLLTLSQQIHEQLQASPEQLPATLVGKLSEIEGLAKRIKKELVR